MCLAALLCEQFLPIRQYRCQDIDQVLRHAIISFSVHSAAVKCSAKIFPFGVKLPNTACWSREKREEGVKPTCFMSKATLGTTGESFIVFVAR